MSSVTLAIFYNMVRHVQYFKIILKSTTWFTKGYNYGTDELPSLPESEPSCFKNPQGLAQMVFNVSTTGSDSSSILKPNKAVSSTSTTTTTSTSSSEIFKPGNQKSLDSLDLDGLVTNYHPDM